MVDLLTSGKRLFDAVLWAFQRVRLLLTICLLFVSAVLASRTMGKLLSGSAGNIVQQIAQWADSWTTVALITVWLALALIILSSAYFPHRTLWNTRFKLMKTKGGDIAESFQVVLAEKDIQKRLQDFSVDATELSLIAGNGDFLKDDPAQLEELTTFGSQCRMLISTADSLGHEIISKLTKSGVGVRLYPHLSSVEKNGGDLRGRLKRTANGMSACLFDKVGHGFRVVDLQNDLLVHLTQQEFERWYKAGKHPLIKHVIFDIGGVAFDGDVADFFDSLTQIFPDASLTRANDYLMLDESLNLGRTDITQVVERRIGRALQEFERQEIKKSWSSTWSLNPEVKEMIISLKKNGYTVSFCSNCDKDNAETYELKGYFEEVDEVFLSCQLGIVKPNKQFFDTMFDRLDAKPWECVFLDDMRANIDAGKSLGMNSIFVPRGGTTGNRKAEVMIERLGELAVRGSD